MDLSKIEDVVGLHRGFATEVLRQAAGEAAGRPEARDLASALGLAQDRLARARRSKEEAVQRHDAEIARLEAKVQELKARATPARGKGGGGGRGDGAGGGRKRGPDRP